MSSILKAEQDARRDTIATTGEIHRLEQKIEQVAIDVTGQERRRENVEEHTGTRSPHQNEQPHCSVTNWTIR